MAHFVADGEIGKTQQTWKKRGKRVKNIDDADKTWMVQEKHASAEELSPMDPTDVIYSA